MRRPEQALHIQLIRSALFDEAAGWMAYNCDVPVVHCANHAFSLLITRQIELVVDGGDNDIEPCQDLIRQVEAAVGQNVNLHALEHCKIMELCVELVDFINLPGEPPGIQAVSD